MPTSQSVFPVPDIGIDPRIRVFRRHFDAVGEFEGMEVDAYIVTTDTTVIVLDTLLCPEDVAEMMTSVQSDLVGRQLLVVNSHADWDHAWGNGYFTGIHTAPILAHDHGRIRLLSEEARLELANFQSRYPLFANVTLVPPSLTFSDRLTISGGDLTIELLAAPGHHRDHIAAWIPELRLLFAFDAVEMPLPCLENASAVPAMIDTLQRFLALAPEGLLCSHGKVTSPQLIKDNLSYLYELGYRAGVFIQAHQPGGTELEHAAETIGYTFDEVIAGRQAQIDRTFYSWAHDANARYMLQWLKDKS